MSNQLNKLASELRKIKPSKQSRAGGMEAAMAAFSEEFLPETAAAKVDANVNVKSAHHSDVAQSSPAEPRVKARQTHERRVEPLGRQTLSKFGGLINFKPQTMMLAGSCAAALIAGLIILPNVGEVGINDQDVKVNPIVSVADNMPVTKSVLETQTAMPQLASNVVTIERRVLKTAGYVETLEIPAEYGTIERRILLNPERSHWREFPRTPEEIAANAPISYERINEPAEFKIETEQVVLRQAMQDLVKIPPVYETVKETIRIHADGSTETLESEILLSRENEPTLTAERDLKSTPKTIFRERRVLKMPARTIERVIPPVTRQETRRVEKLSLIHI